MGPRIRTMRLHGCENQQAGARKPLLVHSFAHGCEVIAVAGNAELILHDWLVQHTVRFGAH